MMDSAHVKILRSNHMQLVNGMNGDAVSLYLHEKSILTNNDVDTISSLASAVKKNEKLLDMITHRGSQAYQHFVEALKINNEDIKLPASQGDNADGRPVVLEVDEKPSDSPATKQQKTTENQYLDFTDMPPEAASEQEDGRLSLLTGGSKKPKTIASPLIAPTDSSFDPNDVYSMNTDPRGFCVVINNKDFEPSSGMEKYPRKGTDVDANMAKELFQEIGYIVECHRNQTVYQMRQILKRASTRNYANLSSFCCIILSHGQEGVVYGTDGTVDIRELAAFSRGSNLSGKPKLFLFQACQGSEYMDSVERDCDGRMETDGPPDLYGNEISLPSEADFVYGYSTVPGYYSWRNSQSGSWFIQAVVEVFRQYAHKMDVVRMMTRVNRIVATKKSQTGQRLSHNKRQISSIVSQLRKDFYLFPVNGPLKTSKGSVM